MRHLVCATCLEDEGLKEFALKHGRAEKCGYCGVTAKTRIVVVTEALVEFMRERISEEWADPSNDAPICSAEGGFQVETFEAEELFDKLGLHFSNEELYGDMLREFSQHLWCQRDWQLLPPSKRWASAWSRFQHVVKHERRYTFWYSFDDFEDVSHPDYLPPGGFLAEIEGVIRGARLSRILPVGTAFWRLQLHPRAESIVEAARFASPPLEKANQPNRMSPAGVPMFYGAEAFDTAYVELVNPNDRSLHGMCVSGALFSAAMPLTVLDLSSIPPQPSYFVPGGRIQRHAIQFLKGFVRDLSQPIERDGRQHIEYVPTQVFTESVRHVMKAPGGGAFHGIVYSSSKNGKRCCVIFATHDECLPNLGPLSYTEQKLAFVPGSVRTLTISAD